MCVPGSNVSTAYKAELSLKSRPNRRINTVLRRRIAALRKWSAVGFAIVTSSMTFLSLYISRWWRQTWDTCLSFKVVSQSEARTGTEHGLKLHIHTETSTVVQLIFSVCFNWLWRVTVRGHRLKWIIDFVFSRKLLKSFTCSFVMRHRSWVCE